MTKLCPRGKAAAKRKFSVYPSAYANAYASKICAGKIKDPSGKKRKDWGPKKAAMGRAMVSPLTSKYNKGTKEPIDLSTKEGEAYLRKNNPGLTYETGNELPPFIIKPKKKPKKNLKKFNTGGNTKIKKVAKALHKASNLHKQQAKALDSIKLKGGGAAIKGLNFKGVF